MISNFRSSIPNLEFAGVPAGVLAVAALSFFSMLRSPVRPLVWPEWGNLAAGLSIFAFARFLSPEDRKKTDRALRVAAWGTVLIAGFQAFVLKSGQISASLTNPNALALFTVMLLPLALSWKDWLLAGSLVIILIWTQSAGAAAALIVAAGFYARRSLSSREFKKNRLVFALLAVALALALSQVPAQSFGHRLLWWKSAAQMFLARPFFGFGHAAFTFVYPAFRGAAADAPGSIYVHSYYLEFLAENGIFCAILWFALLWRAAWTKAGFAGYALLAALIHSVIDFGLSVPANFWIFCYLAASENPGRGIAGGTGWGGGAGLPGQKNGARALFPAAAAVLAAAWLNLCFVRHRALSAQEGAAAAYAAQDLAAAENGFRMAFEIENGPAPLEALGKTEHRLAFERKDRGRLFSAAVLFERALLMNPYSASAYRDLAAVYSSAGEEMLLRGLQDRKEKTFR